MKTIFELSTEITKWSKANFGNTPVTSLDIIEFNAKGENPLKINAVVELNWMAPLLGMGEEIGELSKQCMSDMVRWHDHHEVVDAIADIGIYFCDYLGRRNVRMDLNKFSPIPAPKHFTTMLASAYGSILHCELKCSQKIRGMDDPTAFLKANRNACGMFYESLAMGCQLFVGKELEEVIDSVFTAKVSKRDWKKNKETGGE